MKAPDSAAVMDLSLERMVLEIGAPLVVVTDYLQPLTLEDVQ